MGRWGRRPPRSQSTVEWPDRGAFERAFYDEGAQADLKENLTKLGDYRFIVSEITAGR